MDALSTAHQVSPLFPKSFLSTPSSSNPLLLPLKPQPPPPFPTTTTATLSFKSNRRSLSHLPIFTATTSPPIKAPPQTSRKAATGYAAALLDAACCDGALGIVARDARRVKRVVEVALRDARVEEVKKGEVVVMSVERGGIYGKLVVMVRMLVGKGKVGVVGEVMDEFGRLWEELCGGRAEKMVFLGKEKKGRRSFVNEGELKFAM